MIPAEFAPALRDTLLTGSYNLLLGSGISLDSRNGRGHILRDTDELRRDLCVLTSAPDTTSLSRVYPLLSSLQRQTELVETFCNCVPGPSVANLPRFLWRRLFTFNIDDVLEKLYETTPDRKQALVPLNFDSPFEPTPQKNELYGVHLHGWVRQPNSGFVFSSAEYVRNMSSLNPWMHLLSEILATEPFIIAGSSLNEIDLEFYLSHRNPATPRRGRGPSLLIEPNPNVVTRSDCKRYGLVLVEATFRQFMEWLRAEYPTPPTVFDLVVPNTSTLFSDKPAPGQLLRFFSDFELVTAADRPLSPVPSPFLYGREPQWDDLHQHIDIERQDNARLSAILDEIFASTSQTDPRLVIVLDEAGVGKTTVIKRIAHSYAKTGKPVLTLHALSRIDTNIAIACLSRIKTQLLLVVDGLADHVDQLMELLANTSVSSRVVVLAAERSYRSQYLDVILGPTQRRGEYLLPLTLNECQQLIERYRQLGLVGSKHALRDPNGFAGRILNDPVAIAICRILNDFRPLDAIVDSLVKAATPDHHLPYLCVCLAEHCYGVGLRYSLLQAIVGPGKPINQMFEQQAPLRLAFNALHDEYVVPLNPVIGEQILHRSSRYAPTNLQAAFTGIASALVPHVNRRAIMRRSPEARLAGRLFDADKVVKPLLGSAAENFFVSVQKEWEWNSRYWEQRALLAAETDLNTAVQYARHAVAIESHSFPLTTLGKVLLMVMEKTPAERASVFAEAFEKLAEAITSEVARSRISVHPYATLITGAARYLEFGEQLTPDQRDRLLGFRIEARNLFPNDMMINNALQRLRNIFP
jgi:SIR2-like domain